METLHLLDQLEEAISEGRRLPMSGGVVVARQRLLDLVDQLRAALPLEIYQARELLQAGQQVMAQAQAEAARIVAQAQQEAEEVVARARQEAARLLAEAQAEAERRLARSEAVREAQERAHLLLQEAEAQARQIVQEAQQEARRQMAEADAYALRLLRRLLGALEQAMAAVRRGIEALEGGT